MELLDTFTIAAPSVANWGASFLGLERSEGIRRVVFRGADFGLDGLTFDASPLPEPRIGLSILGGLAAAFWRGRRGSTGMKTSARPQSPQRRRDRGTVIVLVTIALGALLSMLSLALGASQIYAARGQAQNAADAAALSAMRAFRAGATDAEAIAAGNAIGSEHPGQGVPIGAAALTLVAGTYDFTGRSFQPGTRFGGRAFEAGARVDPRFVFPLFGLESRGVSASAIAAVRRRTVCLAQDVTASYYQSGNFPRALEANHALLRSMTPADEDPDGAGLSGDTLGIISFARDSYVHQGISPVQGNSRELHEAIDRRSDGPGLDPNDRDTLAQDDVAERLCTSGGAPGGRCYGTDIAIGIDRCEELLTDPGVSEDTERILVLVSDGLPCLIERGSQRVTFGQQTAIAAADRAGAAGIHLFSITLDNASGSGVCMGSDVTFNDGLARGQGKGVTVRDPTDLVTILGSILRQMPVHLVQ